MFQGSIPALVTPMLESGEIDFEGLKKLVHMHLENGTDALVILGTTGEAPTITQKERKKIITQVVKQVNGKIPVIVGTGTNSTKTTIELTHEAMELGVDACLIVTPYYNKPTQEGLYQHFSTVAQEVPVPIVLYNVPGRTGCDLLPETVERLADIPNIVAIKEASGKLERVPDLLKRCGDRINLLSGDDDLAMDFILQGGRGVISVTSNVAPQIMHDMSHAALEKNESLAKELNKKLELLHQRLFLESNPIPVKWALTEMGMIEEGIRLPLVKLSEKHRSRICEALDAAGIKVVKKQSVPV